MKNVYFKNTTTHSLKATIILAFVAAIFSGCKTQKSLVAPKLAQNPFIRNIYC